MELVLTKKDCKQNAATKVKSARELKSNGKNIGQSLLFRVPFYNADQLIDEILFSRILFSEQLTLRSMKDNKLFILQNCSLYNTRKIPHFSH